MKKISCQLTFILTCLISSIGFTQSTATYDIDFTSTWNSADHGTLPGNAHWSNLVGANHNANITFLEMGGTATQGIENVAELGSNSVFNSEVQTAINSGNAEQWLEQSFSPFAAISSATLVDVVVSEDYPLLTLVSMIAPSPDWIIAVNSLNLWDTSMNKWKESFTIDLFPYDAGTENGFNYSTSNAATVPQGVITNIAGASGYPFGPEKIGTLTVTFKSTSLSINAFEEFSNIKIYPNPVANGKISISNGSYISKIELFDVLGKQVKRILQNTSAQEFNIELPDLKAGIYLLKLYGVAGEIVSRKLIVQ
jgi:hypothetical protein